MLFRKHSRRFLTSFNRYMVECELIHHEFLVQRDIGFNRYMVECEYGLLSEGATADDCFNRYMVECECT